MTGINKSSSSRVGRQQKAQTRQHRNQAQQKAIQQSQERASATRKEAGSARHDASAASNKASQLTKPQDPRLQSIQAHANDAQRHANRAETLTQKVEQHTGAASDANTRGHIDLASHELQQANAAQQQADVATAKARESSTLAQDGFNQLARTQQQSQRRDISFNTSMGGGMLQRRLHTQIDLAQGEPQTFHHTSGNAAHTNVNQVQPTPAYEATDQDLAIADEISYTATRPGGQMQAAEQLAGITPAERRTAIMQSVMTGDEAAGLPPSPHAATQLLRTGNPEVIESFGQAFDQIHAQDPAQAQAVMNDMAQPYANTTPGMTTAPDFEPLVNAVQQSGSTQATEALQNVPVEGVQAVLRGMPAHEVNAPAFEAMQTANAEFQTANAHLQSLDQQLATQQDALRQQMTESGFPADFIQARIDDYTTDFRADNNYEAAASDVEHTATALQSAVSQIQDPALLTPQQARETITSLENLSGQPQHAEFSLQTMDRLLDPTGTASQATIDANRASLAGKVPNFDERAGRIAENALPGMASNAVLNAPEGSTPQDIQQQFEQSVNSLRTLNSWAVRGENVRVGMESFRALAAGVPGPQVAEQIRNLRDNPISRGMAAAGAVLGMYSAVQNGVEGNYTAALRDGLTATGLGSRAVGQYLTNQLARSTGAIASRVPAEMLANGAARAASLSRVALGLGNVVATGLSLHNLWETGDRTYAVEAAGNATAAAGSLLAAAGVISGPVGVAAVGVGTALSLGAATWRAVGQFVEGVNYKNEVEQRIHDVLFPHITNADERDSSMYHFDNGFSMSRNDYMWMTYNASIAARDTRP